MVQQLGSPLEEVSPNQCLAASLKCLRYAGLWPHTDDTVYWVFTVCACSNLFFLIGMFTVVFFGDSASDSVENTGHILTLVPSVVAVVMISRGKAKLEAVIDGMRWTFSRGSLGGRKHLLVGDIVAEERRAVKVYVVIAFTTTFFNVLLPTAKSFIARSGSAAEPSTFSVELPFKMWTLFGGQEVEYAFQGVVIGLAIASIATLDTFSFAMVKYAADQFKALGVLLEGVASLDQHSLAANEKMLSDMVKMHQEVLDNVQNLADVFSPLLLAHFLTSSANLCLVGYNASTADDMQHVMASASHLVLLLSRIFLLSYFSSAIMNQSTNISHVAYSCNWFPQSENFKRMLTLIICRAQRPVIMRTGAYGFLSLETFAALMQGAYTYYTMLKKINIS